MADEGRSRRLGSRPGKLPADVSTVLRAEAERLDSLDDPIAAVQAVGDTFAAMDHELERFALVRIRAVARLRQEGWSYDQIARATGLSKGRVAVLAKDARATER